MKKVILSLVTLLAATTLATAQMRPTIKVEAGANFSNMTAKANGETKDGDMLIGYRVGAGVEFGISDGFYINPGLYFLSRGAKETVETPKIADYSMKVVSSTWLHNVEIPVHVGYRAAFAPDMAVSIQAGPAGVFEFDNFTAGSRAIAEAIAKATKNGAFSLIGGGDSVACINKFGMADQVSYISTGGGALLEAIEGKILPGVAAIKGE